MTRVRLIHWHAPEAAERAARLRRAGYQVRHWAVDAGELKRLRQTPPDAAVIDLSRLPSHGRDVALALRHAKATRRVALVFVDGQPEKVARIRKLLPDASYTTWGRIRSALKAAIAHPPADPIVPGSAMAGYSGTPLPKKLGINPNQVVALVDAPPGFERVLGALPAGVTLRRGGRGRRDLTILFARSRDALARRIEALANRLEEGGALWIAWPKKASRRASDLSQAEVRKVGLAAGLVDYKVCAIDPTWSGLKFSRRRR